MNNSKLTLEKYQTLLSALLNMQRPDVYVNKKKIGRAIGVELNNIYSSDIMVSVESNDYQQVSNRLLKDISFNPL